MWSYNYSDELYHHGIKGQRWGIRRYQNKDGTLTPAGKKRAAKLESEYEKVTGKKMGDTSQTSSKKSYSKKPVSGKDDETGKLKSLTDDELRNKVNRTRLENEYKNLMGEKNKKESSLKNANDDMNEIVRKERLANDRLNEQIRKIKLTNELKSLTPETKSIGRKIVEELRDQSISVLKDKGTKLVGDYIDKQLRDKLGMNTKDEMSSLKKEAEKLNYQRQIALAKSYLESQKPKKTETRNLIGDINDLTDQQVKDMITRLDDENKLRDKLANRK